MAGTHIIVMLSETNISIKILRPDSLFCLVLFWYTFLFLWIGSTAVGNDQTYVSRANHLDLRNIRITRLKKAWTPSSEHEALPFSLKRFILKDWQNFCLGTLIKIVLEVHDIFAFGEQARRKRRIYCRY